MKKAASVTLVFILFLFMSQYAWAMTSVPMDRDADYETRELRQMADDFTHTAMTEFKNVGNSQLTYPQISSGVEQYSLKMAKAFIDAGIDTQKAGMMMQKAAAWYGQSLKAIYNQENYADVIQDYTGKIADLFSREHLDIAVQSRIISLTSNNLEVMNALFKDLKQ